MYRAFISNFEQPRPLFDAQIAFERDLALDNIDARACFTAAIFAIAGIDLVSAQRVWLF